MCPNAFPASRSERGPVNCILMVSFVEVIRYDQFLNWFNEPALKSKDFLNWLCDTVISSVREIVRVINRAVQCKAKAVLPRRLSMSRKLNNLVLGELGTEQVLRILRESVAVQTHILKDKRTVFMFLQLFQGN